MFLAAPSDVLFCGTIWSEHKRCLEGLMPCPAVKDFSSGSWGRRAERGCRQQPGGRGIAVTCCYCRAGGELVKFAAGFPHPCSRDWHCIPGASDSALSPLGLDCQHYVFIRYYGLQSDFPKSCYSEQFPPPPPAQCYYLMKSIHSVVTCYVVCKL